MLDSLREMRYVYEVWFEEYEYGSDVVGSYIVCFCLVCFCLVGYRFSSFTASWSCVQYVVGIFLPRSVYTVSVLSLDAKSEHAVETRSVFVVSNAKHFIKKSKNFPNVWSLEEVFRWFKIIGVYKGRIYFGWSPYLLRHLWLGVVIRTS